MTIAKILVTIVNYIVYINFLVNVCNRDSVLEPNLILLES